MFRGLRRPLALLVPVLMLPALAACGSEGAPDEKTADGFDAVTIEGDFNAAPEVTWNARMEADKVSTKVLIEGDGEQLKDGDRVLTHLWVGNGFTQDESFSTYNSEDEEAADDESATDEEAETAEPAPELITVGEDISPIFEAAIKDQTIGSRVAVVASAEEGFGEGGNPALGIGNQDSVLLIVDLVELAPELVPPLEKPQGERQPREAWVPKFTGNASAPTGFDFTGVPKPTGKLQTSVLIKGDGATVEAGQELTVNYLGQVFQGEEPFDESFTRDPATFPIGTGGVIQGWDRALVGQTVGSRVVVAIPPRLGYGEAGNEQAGITGTDTLYFVVDILAAN